MRGSLPIAIARWENGQFILPARVDREGMASVPEGALVEIHFYKERTPRQNRYLHTLLSSFCENVDGIHLDPEAIKEAVKAKHGWIDHIRLDQQGRHNIILKSTADMSRAEMTEFIEQAIAYLAEMRPDFDFKALRKEAEAQSKRART
jgi:hypothetical protein